MIDDVKKYTVWMECFNCGHTQKESFPFGKQIPSLGSELPTCTNCGAAPVFRIKERTKND